MTSFDPDELNAQAAELLQLISSLRPRPNAKLVSRKTMEMMAAMSGDADLIRVVKEADEQTLFWECEGEYIEQRIKLEEFPAS